MCSLGPRGLRKRQSCDFRPPRVTREGYVIPESLGLSCVKRGTQCDLPGVLSSHRETVVWGMTDGWHGISHQHSPPSTSP